MSQRPPGAGEGEPPSGEEDEGADHAGRGREEDR